MNHETMPAQGRLTSVMGKSDENALIDTLQDAAIELTGLAEVLCSQAQETIGAGDFRNAQKLAWAYD